ncbi:MAG TPA: ABC-2 family transporter protein [Mobilitalea sp.]|nr:ABC-2 family transporter protein [Mobilitalea sp.]
MRLYYRFFLIHLKSIFQYKKSFLFLVIGQFLTSFNMFLGILFLFERFHTVKNYRFDEIMLCFSIVLMGYTLAEIFGRGFDLFSHTISNGEFDRILLRPRNEVFLVLAGKIELARAGRLLQAVVMLVYAITISRVEWDIDKIFTLILMILGGTVIFGGLFIIFASLCFFTLEGLEFMNIFTDGAREYGKYPIDIYGRGVLKFCTYVIPYTLFQYYPFQYLIGKNDNKLFMLLPLIACIFALPCYLFWRFGVRHYKSTGS